MNDLGTKLISSTHGDINRISGLNPQITNTNPKNVAQDYLIKRIVLKIFGYIKTVFQAVFDLRLVPMYLFNRTLHVIGYGSPRATEPKGSNSTPSTTLLQTPSIPKDPALPNDVAQKAGTPLTTPQQVMAPSIQATPTPANEVAQKTDVPPTIISQQVMVPSTTEDSTLTNEVPQEADASQQQPSSELPLTPGQTEIIVNNVEVAPESLGCKIATGIAVTSSLLYLTGDQIFNGVSSLFQSPAQSPTTTTPSPVCIIENNGKYEEVYESDNNTKPCLFVNQPAPSGFEMNQPVIAKTQDQPSKTFNIADYFPFPASESSGVDSLPLADPQTLPLENSSHVIDYLPPCYPTCSLHEFSSPNPLHFLTNPNIDTNSSIDGLQSSDNLLNRRSDWSNTFLGTVSLAALFFGLYKLCSNTSKEIKEDDTGKKNTNASENLDQLSKNDTQPQGQGLGDAPHPLFEPPFDNQEPSAEESKKESIDLAPRTNFLMRLATEALRQGQSPLVATTKIDESSESEPKSFESQVEHNAKKSENPLLDEEQSDTQPQGLSQGAVSPPLGHSPCEQNQESNNKNLNQNNAENITGPTDPAPLNKDQQETRVIENVDQSPNEANPALTSPPTSKGQQDVKLQGQDTNNPQLRKWAKQTNYAINKKHVTLKSRENEPLTSEEQKDIPPQDQDTNTWIMKGGAKTGYTEHTIRPKVKKPDEPLPNNETLTSDVLSKGTVSLLSRVDIYNLQKTPDPVAPDTEELKKVESIRKSMGFKKRRPIEQSTPQDQKLPIKDSLDLKETQKNQASIAPISQQKEEINSTGTLSEEGTLKKLANELKEALSTENKANLFTNSQILTEVRNAPTDPFKEETGSTGTLQVEQPLFEEDNLHRTVIDPKHRSNPEANLNLKDPFADFSETNTSSAPPQGHSTPSQEKPSTQNQYPCTQMVFQALQEKLGAVPPVGTTVPQNMEDSWAGALPEKGNLLYSMSLGDDSGGEKKQSTTGPFALPRIPTSHRGLPSDKRPKEQGQPQTSAPPETVNTPYKLGTAKVFGEGVVIREDMLEQAKELGKGLSDSVYGFNNDDSLGNSWLSQNH